MNLTTGWLESPVVTQNPEIMGRSLQAFQQFPDPWLHEVSFKIKEKQILPGFADDRPGLYFHQVQAAFIEQPEDGVQCPRFMGDVHHDTDLVTAFMHNGLPFNADKTGVIVLIVVDIWNQNLQPIKTRAAFRGYGCFCFVAQPADKLGTVGCTVIGYLFPGILFQKMAALLQPLLMRIHGINIFQLRSRYYQ